MKTQWDYTSLAQAYLQRPDYAPQAIDRIIHETGLKPGYKICDIGAGVAHLTLSFLAKGLRVVPVEPNDAMRQLGAQRTKKEFPEVEWIEGTGENTGLKGHQFDLVSFGSSFNVIDYDRALKETSRLLKKGGWFTCLWNHRDLNDPLQAKVEKTIKNRVKKYGYGTRREDQTPIIERSNLFHHPLYFEYPITHVIPTTQWVVAWQSHATLQRQAGESFNDVIEDIRHLLQGREVIEVPYKTVVWLAQARMEKNANETNPSKN